MATATATSIIGTSPTIVVVVPTPVVSVSSSVAPVLVTAVILLVALVVLLISLVVLCGVVLLVPHGGLIVAPVHDILGLADGLGKDPSLAGASSVWEGLVLACH